MRRQFLRVYLGIAAVLVLAALITLFVVDREMRRVVDARLQEAMDPWVERIRERLLRAGDTPEQRTRVLQALNANLPFPVALVPRDSVLIPDRAARRLAARQTVLLTRNRARLLYAPFDSLRLLVLGPLHRPYAGRAEPPSSPLPMPRSRWMEHWLPLIRTRLEAARTDPAGRAALLADLRTRAPFPLHMEPRARLHVSAAQEKRLDEGMPCQVHTDRGLMICLGAGPDSVLAMGPLEGHMGPAGRGAGPHGPRLRNPHAPFVLGASPPRLRTPLFQGAHVLIGALLGILALIGGAVYWLLHPFESRIYELARVAREFGAGQFDRRAAVQGGDDAIALLALRFNEMADRLTDLIERQRDLLRAVSHELRTPLARLFFLVDDAQNCENPQQRNMLLESMETSLQELDALVQELLTFVRLEGTGEDQERTRVDLDEAFAEAAAALDDLRPDIEISLHAGGLQVEGVPRLLRRALLNLLKNAVRHARSRIRVSAEVLDGIPGGVRIHVDDDGPGVPEQARQRVFEPFFRLDASRTSDGSGVGLGLAIVQRIAQVHDGRASVSTSPYGGARFTLDLPNRG